MAAAAGGRQRGRLDSDDRAALLSGRRARLAWASGRHLQSTADEPDHPLPHCATAFKVVADQLRISDGWVRCGQCKEVFDASEHLLMDESEPLLPEMPLHACMHPSRAAP